MKQRCFTAAAPAVLVARGVMLLWTNLRFPGTVPTGMKLFFLFLLILLWLIQIGMERFFTSPFIEQKLGMFSTGVATAFYGFSAIESFRFVPCASSGGRGLDDACAFHVACICGNRSLYHREKQ